MRSRKVPYHDPVVELAQSVPPGESVSFSRDKLRMIDVIAIYYALYPVRVADAGNYFLDLTGKGQSDFSNRPFKSLANGAVVYAQTGHSFLEPVSSRRHAPFIDFLVFLSVSVLVIFIGANVLAAFGISTQVLGRAWFYSSAYLTGFVALNSVFWTLLTFHFPLNLQAIWCVLFLALLSSFVFKRSMPRCDMHAVMDGSAGSSDGRLRGLEFMIRTINILIVLLAVAVTVAIPVMVWDEMLIWVMRSKMLFFDGKIDFHYLAKTHVYYPNLWPMHIHLFMKTVGGCASEIVKWVAASVFLVFVGQLYGAIRSLGFKRLSSAPASCFYLVVFMNLIFFTALPEVILYSLSLGMVTSLIIWMRHQENKSFLYLAFLMALGLCGVKFEGVLIISALVLGIGILGWHNGFALRRLVPIASFLLLFLLPWLWTAWLRSNGFVYEVYHFGQQFTWENIKAIGTVVVNALSQPRNAALFIIPAMVFVLNPNRRPWDISERILLWAAMVFIGFSLFSVVFWPTDDIRLYYPEVLGRLFLRATPFVMLIWASRIFERNVS